MESELPAFGPRPSWIEIGKLFRMRFASLRSPLLSLALLLAAQSARAQDVRGTPNQPPLGSGTPNQPPPGLPPNAPPPSGVAPLATAPAPAPAPAPATVGSTVDLEPKDEGRLRIGFNVNGGWGTGNDFKGPVLGATFRAGYQLNYLMAVYGQITAFAWIASTDKTVNGKAFDLSAVGGYQFTPMFSLTPVDLLELAAGPSLDRIAGGSTKNSVSTANATVITSDTAYSGFYFALHGRAALHIGGKPNTTTGRRVSFTIGFDVHPTFAEGSVITLYTLGLGADWY